MPDTQRPTDSILRRHFDAANQPDWASEPPQESTLIRHHEQMRSVWEHDVEHGTSSASHTDSNPGDNTHPLAIHLARQPAAPTHATSPSPRSRSSTETKVVPPEDSTLKRHFVQLNDVTFAEHPLATHLRMSAAIASAKHTEAPSSPVASGQPHVASTTGSEQGTKQAKAAANDAGGASKPQRQASPSSEPTTGGWVARLLRRIFGG